MSMSVGFDAINDLEKGSLIRGFKGLRNYSLLYIVASLLLGFSLFLGFMRFMMVRRAFNIPLLSESILFLIMGLAGSLILLVAIFVYLMDSMSGFSEFNARYSTSSSMVKIGYLGACLMFIIGFVVRWILPLIGLILIFLGVLLLIVGKIGFVSLLVKLNGDFKESAFLISAVIYVVGILLPPLDFVASIILFIASDSMLSRVKVAQTSAVSV
ncbi:MAG: hypothetical protein NDF51_04470 [archaeon YNP-WB-040]|nr:hypothetical protein [Candidatus Culexarchaeum yellowstonense]